MDRAVVIALAALAVVLVGVIGAGLGFVALSGDPAMQAQRQCAQQRCTHLKITLHTASRVEYSYDLPDGSHCDGFNESHRSGPFGFGGGYGSGGSGCAPAGQTIYGPGKPAPAPTLFPDGNPPCRGAVGFGAPVNTPAGFEVVITNNSSVTCDVAGPAKLMFLDASSRPMNVVNQPASETWTAVALAPGAAAVFAFDVGTSRCVTPSGMVVIASAGTQPVAAPGQVCEPVISHPARAVP